MKIMIIAGTLLLAMGCAKAQLEMIYDPIIGDFIYVDIDIDSDGDIDAFDINKGLYLYGDVDNEGEGYLYTPDHMIPLDLDLEDYN